MSKRAAIAWIAPILLLAAGSRLEAADPVSPPERVLALTIQWDKSGPSVEKVEPKEAPVPLQRGIPQLAGRYYELRDKDGDVHYAGALIDPRPGRGGGPGGSGASTFHVVIPDLPDARHLVILERLSSDPVKGRHVALEQDL